MALRSVREMVKAAKDEIRSLSPEMANREVNEGKAVLVDIRDPREIEREGTIPGAVHAPRGMLEFWVDPESPYHKEALAAPRLILFCASSWRSALAAKTLQDMGHGGVAEIEGGFAAWREARLAVEGGRGSEPARARAPNDGGLEGES